MQLSKDRASWAEGRDKRKPMGMFTEDKEANEGGAEWTRVEGVGNGVREASGAQMLGCVGHGRNFGFLSMQNTMFYIELRAMENTMEFMRRKGCFLLLCGGYTERGMIQKREPV